MRSFLTRLGALGVIAVAFAGCSGSGSSLPINATANSGGQAGGVVIGNSGAGGTAAIRFIHGSPDAGNVDICLDGSRVGTNVAYGAATGYSIIPAGGINHAVTFTAGNSGCGSTTMALIGGQVTLATNSRNTIVATGVVANGTAGAVAYTEPTIGSQSATGSVVVHPASQNLASFAFGDYATSAVAPVTGTVLNAKIAASSDKLSAAGVIPSGAVTTIAVPQPLGSQGIAFYSATTAAPTVPVAELYPGVAPAAAVLPGTTVVGVDAKNTGNVLPFGPSGAVDLVLSVFTIDTATGSTLLGIYEPTTLGY